MASASSGRTRALSSGRVRVAIVIGAVLLVGLLVYLLAAFSSGTSAAAGTTVGGIGIGGMSQEEAAQAVTSGMAARINRPIKLTAEGLTFRVRPADAGLGLDAAASVAPAYGHTWNPIALATTAFQGRDFPLVPTVDDAALESSVTQLADAVARPAVEPRITMRKGTARLKEGEPGQALDVEATTEALRDAYLRPRRPIAAPVVDVPPVISQEAAEGALELASAATSAPVIVQAETISATLSGSDIGDALTFTVTDGEFVPQLNGARLHDAIRDELVSIETPGRDATFRIKRGTPRVVSAKVGRGIEDDALATAVAGVLGNPEGERTVQVPVGVREPELTTAEAAQLGITEKLSSFTQNYPYAAYRSQNIGQAAERVNGTLLMPGETFSMNDTILERTVENGYTVGYVVGEGGVFREDLGGGVSASATTTWTAAFFAGMERVQTVAHSIWISRYQPGLEATVAWGIFDLKFRNDLDHAVFITASTTQTSMTVSFWGTPEYDRIEAESGPRTGVVAYSKVYNEAPDCEPQSGIDGFTITVDRVFYQGGVEVRREPITTRYKPAPQVICDKKPKKKKPGQGDEFAAGEDQPGAESTADPSQGPTDAPADQSGGKPSDKPSNKPSEKPSEKPNGKPSGGSGDQPSGGDVFDN